MAMAAYWTALLNCESEDAPCLECTACRQIADQAFNDFLIIERPEGKQDIPVDSIRDLLPVWGQPPHGRGSRVTLISEAQNLNASSGNALLKTLEEPRPGNVFVLTAPQRERLLETLVSRSWVLTLAWPVELINSPEVGEWVNAMVDFWRTGRGWFSRTSAKGALNHDLALEILTGCQRELRNSMTDPSSTVSAGKIDTIFDLKAKRRLDLALDKAQEAVHYQVTPALVLDWLCMAARPVRSPR
jgi:DNA polymerase-3 subunit delta'